MKIMRIACVIVATGIVAGCSHFRTRPDASLEAARFFVAAAENEVYKLPAGPKRDDLLYDLGAKQAMLGDVEEALRSAGLCEDYNKKSSTYGYIAEIQAGTGDTEGAKRTLLLAKEAAVKGLPQAEGDTWVESVAREQAKLGDFTDAEDTLQFVEDLDSKQKYRVSFAAYSSPREALKLLDRIKDPFSRDLQMGSIVVREIELGNVDSARELAERISDLSLRADAYLAIVDGEADRGNAKGVEEAYAEAKRLAALDEGNHFREIVNHQLSRGDIQGALETAAMSSNALDYGSILVDIARAQSEGGNHEAAVPILEKAAALPVASQYNKTWFMEGLVAAWAETGNTTQALKTVSMMEDYGDTKAGAYQDIIGSLLSRGKTEGARTIVGNISDPRWQATALASIGAAETHAGNLIASRKTFAEARSIAATVPEGDPESWTYVRSTIYNRIASWQARTGDYDDIKRWTPLIPDPVDRASCWLGAAFWLTHRHYHKQKAVGENTRTRFYSSFSP